MRCIKYLFWIFIGTRIAAAHISFELRQPKPLMPILCATQDFQPTASMSVAASRSQSAVQALVVDDSYQQSIPTYKNALAHIVAQTTPAQMQAALEQYKIKIEPLPTVMLTSLQSRIHSELVQRRQDYTIHSKVRLSLLQDMHLPSTTGSLSKQQELTCNSELLCAFYENEARLQQLNFEIAVREAQIAHNFKQLSNYQTELHAAEYRKQAKIVDTQNYPLLIQQRTLLAEYLQRMRTVGEVAKKTIDNPTIGQIERQRALDIIEHGKASIPLCKAELQKIDSILTYGKECIALVTEQNAQIDNLCQQLDANGVLNDNNKQMLTLIAAETDAQLTQEGLELLKLLAIDHQPLQNFVSTSSKKEFVGRLYAIINRTGKEYKQEKEFERTRSYQAAITHSCITAFDMVRQCNAQRALAFMSMASTIEKAQMAALAPLNDNLITPQFQLTSNILLGNASKDAAWFEKLKIKHKAYRELNAAKQNQHAAAFLTNFLAPDVRQIQGTQLERTVSHIHDILYAEQQALPIQQDKKTTADSRQAPLLTSWKETVQEISGHLAAHAHKATASTPSHTQRDLALVAAIKATHREPYKRTTITYAIDHQTVKALEQLGFDAKTVFQEQYCGSQLQHHIHEKLMTSLNRVGSVAQDNREIQQLLRGAIHLNKTGQQLNNQSYFNQALSAQHACELVIDYAKTMADIGCALGEGIASGALSSVTTLGNMGKTALDVVTFPEEYAPRIQSAFTKATLGVCEFVASTREHFALIMGNDIAGLEAFSRRRDENGKKFTKFSEALLKKYHDTPLREKVKLTTQFLTECHLLGTLGEALSESVALHRAGATITVTDIVTHPQQALAHEVIEVTINTIAHEPATVKNALKSLQQENVLVAITKANSNISEQVVNLLNKPIDALEVVPGFIEVPHKPALPKIAGQSAAPNALKQAESKLVHATQTIIEHRAPAVKYSIHADVKSHQAKGFKALVTNVGGERIGEVHYFSTKCPTSKELYHHLFRAWQKGKRKLLVGQHMPIKQPELIHKVTDGPNKHGIRKVILKKGKYISDPKTIGPDHWNQVDYIKHLREAYNNVTEKKFVREGVFQLTGTDQSGIRWYMYVELQNNSYKITTGYPIYE